MNVQRNRNIDAVRILLCAAVFLYHLNLLRGGYLAVCGFFALSGYFTASSVHRHANRILKYSCSRIVRICLPLFVTVCLTVLTVSPLACDNLAGKFVNSLFRRTEILIAVVHINLSVDTRNRFLGRILPDAVLPGIGTAYVILSYPDLVLGPYRLGHVRLKRVMSPRWGMI